MNIHESSILITDDEPELLEIFSTWLSDAGCPHVVCAADGDIALALFDVDQFHLLISDLNMPKRGGMALLHSLAAAGRSVPAILFVATPHKLLLAELRKLGVKLCLSKPIRRADLVQAVVSVLSAS